MLPLALLAAALAPAQHHHGNYQCIEALYKLW
jgi:hypothetical protein